MTSEQEQEIRKYFRDLLIPNGETKEIVTIWKNKAWIRQYKNGENNGSSRQNNGV